MKVESTLDTRVQSLVNLLFDQNQQASAISSLNMDPSKILNLNESHITQAFKVLSELEPQIQKKGIKIYQEAASQEYYSTKS